MLAIICACAAVACFSAAAFTCAGCSPAADQAIVNDDKALMPYVGLACTIAGVATGGSEVTTLVCDAVEGVGNAIALLPVPEAGPDAAPVVTAQLVKGHVVLQV